MLITHITWTLHNYCKAGCSYCPSSQWGGDEPRPIEQYLNFANYAIEHFDKMKRTINWSFNGGEPLDLFDLPQLLKFCKKDDNLIELTTNGGRLWLDWWALESHIDILNLTYHYWQQPNLIKFIIDTFSKKQKTVNVTIPIRYNFFDEDFSRALQLEKEYNIKTIKQLLIQNMDWMLGYYPYTESQLEAINGIGSQSKKNMLGDQTFEEYQEHLIKISPSFAGQKCNDGIEKLNISSAGFVGGASCGNTYLGNIWDSNFKLISEPQICNMRVCSNLEDQKITKFP